MEDSDDSLWVEFFYCTCHGDKTACSIMLVESLLLHLNRSGSNGNASTRELEICWKACEVCGGRDGVVNDLWLAQENSCARLSVRVAHAATLILLSADHTESLQLGPHGEVVVQLGYSLDLYNNTPKTRCCT